MINRDRNLDALILSVSGIGRRRLRKIKQWCETNGLALTEWWTAAGGQRPAVLDGFGLTTEQKEYARQTYRRFSPQGYQSYLAERKITLIFEEDPTYPFLLKQVETRPPLLYVQGNSIDWNTKPVAIVGTRQITGYGQTVTRTLVKELVRSGVLIISGGMIGVDLTAHMAALEMSGKSVAVLGFGFDHWYPAFSPLKSRELLARGATLISEYPPFTQALSGNFPSRNRIVAGMSLGVVVTEAGQDSGSHITAKQALEFGREVFAVPGPITSQYSEGTKWLINEGAFMVSSAHDILLGLGFEGLSRQHPEYEKNRTRPQFSSILQEKVYLELQSQVLSLDEVAEKTELSIPKVSTLLSQMELDGWIKQVRNKWLVY